MSIRALAHRASTLALLAATLSSLGAGLAHAEDNQEVKTATGTEGTTVEQIVVTAERNQAATSAPSKASLLETQPQSIITHKFIEQATPESGDYTTAILIAPSVAGVSSNGGGVGDTNTSTLRGFQDGQYNITFDGIAFGDANDTTHHPAAFFPGSTIGAAVVDRGPGAAGDLGQANFGGAVHLFSPVVEDKMGGSQKVTYGSFNTQSYVTTLQSGRLDWLHGTKILLNFDERSSDSELSYAGGEAFNQTLKAVTPITDKLTMTVFSSFNYTRYYQTDNGAGLGDGLTNFQRDTYGLNFSLDNNPNDEHYYKFNYVKKHTDFNYIDFKWDAGHGVTVENQTYDYFYSNKTVSAASVLDPVGVSPSPSSGVSAVAIAAGANPDDIAGYHKLNRYQTFGDIIRVNEDFGFGTLRAGGLVESSWADRYILYYDLTTGKPDNGYGSVPGANVSYIEPSRWFQWQTFADFEWRPLQNLTITPGIKYIDYTRSIDASLEGSGFPAIGRRQYDKTAYFLTANYRITPNWSVYGQAATGFLIPPVKTLAAVNGTTASTSPEQTATYQMGTVLTAGRFTFDADVYRINATNVLINRSGTACGCYINAGSGVYSGVEAEGAYSIGYGLTLFANGSINDAKDTGPGTPGTFTNAPKGTAALGAIFAKGPWQATFDSKTVGAQVGSDGVTPIPAYTTLDGSVSYDFGRFKVKLAGFNLADRRALLDSDGTQFVGPNNPANGYYVYQVGRQIQVTLQAKF